MNILELILSRRTVHSYTEEAVPQAILEEAIRCGIYAPNHKMTWPWMFLIAGPKSRQRICELMIKIKKQSGELTAVAQTALENKYLREGALVVAVLNKAADPVTLKEDYASMAAALQNMALYLWDRGYGSKWATGGIIRHPEAYPLFDIDESTQEISGFFWIGKSRGAMKPIARPPLQNFIKQLP